MTTGIKHSNLFAASLRIFLLPLLCLYFIFSAPVKLYEKKKCSVFELQEQPLEENESSELCDESEALLLPGVLLPEPDHLYHVSGLLEIFYVSKDYTEGVHRPPELSAS